MERKHIQKLQSRATDDRAIWSFVIQSVSKSVNGKRWTGGSRPARPTKASRPTLPRNSGENQGVAF